MYEYVITLIRTMIEQHPLINIKSFHVETTTVFTEHKIIEALSGYVAHRLVPKFNLH